MSVGELRAAADRLDALAADVVAHPVRAMYATPDTETHALVASAAWHNATRPDVLGPALAAWLRFEADCYRTGSVRGDHALAVARAISGGEA